MSRSERLRAAELPRIADVLARTLAEPTDALRKERADIVRDAVRRPHAGVRRLLAEHYRALGIPAQAGRWGAADSQWVTADEIRALRLDLLEQRPDHPTRRYLGLASSDDVLAALADLERGAKTPPESPWEIVVIVIALLGLLAVPVGVVLLLAAGVLALLAIALPGWLLPTVLVCVVAVVVAIAVVALSTGLEHPVGSASSASRSRRDPYAVEFERLLSELEDPAERRSLAIGAMRSPRAATRTDARRVLIDAARALGRDDDVARWGASWTGATTAEERQALARRLVGARDPLGTFIERSHREPIVLGVDERDVLLRAGVDVAQLDAFDVLQRAAGARPRSASR